MSDETDRPASSIIDAFGGIRPMAARLGIPVSTVQGWKQRDTIPAGRMEVVRAAAAAEEIDLDINPGSDDPEVPASGDAPSPVTVKAKPEASRASDDPEPEPSVPSSPDRAAPPACGNRVAVLALVVALCVGGWVWWSIQGPGADAGDNAPGADPAALAALARDVSALRAALAELSPPDLEPTLAPLRGEIDGLRDALAAQKTGESGDSARDEALIARLEALEAEIQNAVQLASTNMQAMSGGLVDFDTNLKALTQAQAKSLADVTARIAALEKGQRAEDAEVSRASTLALAAGQLRVALERGVPYPGALELLESMGTKDPQLSAAVTALRGMSETGVVTGPGLEVSFARLVPELLAARRAEADAATGGLVDRLTGRINDIVSIRRTGADVPGDGIDARIARAEIYLEDRDVGAARAAFDGITGPAAEILAPWLAQARGHIEAHNALAMIEAQAIARLRADGGS
ncbi:MAG: COG4223 family protein [Alphaproteobacteria bacterium]